MLWNITCVIIIDNNKDLHSLFTEMSIMTNINAQDVILAEW